MIKQQMKCSTCKINVSGKTSVGVFVDGRFVEERKNPEIRFRGSDNQRILDIPKCINQNKIVELEL